MRFLAWGDSTTSQTRFPINNINGLIKLLYIFIETDKIKLQVVVYPVMLIICSGFFITESLGRQAWKGIKRINRTLF